MKANRQLELPFTQPEETQVERCRRILSGRLGHKVRPASEMLFDYDRVTAQHHRRVHARERANGAGGA